MNWPVRTIGQAKVTLFPRRRHNRSLHRPANRDHFRFPSAV